MKRCKCEHWQTCPTCYPQGFDEHGARKPVEIPQSREELQREITTLREQVETLQSDADRLDFLDRNLAFNTGWSVGIAPVGLISVTAVGLRKTTIREAIDNARNEK